MTVESKLVHACKEEDTERIIKYINILGEVPESVLVLVCVDNRLKSLKTIIDHSDYDDNLNVMRNRGMFDKCHRMVRSNDCDNLLKEYELI
jgi:hypothetical protein